MRIKEIEKKKEKEIIKEKKYRKQEMKKILKN